ATVRRGAGVHAPRPSARASIIAEITSAAPRPAFSISTMPGTWQDSMAYLSNARICARVRTGIIGVALRLRPNGSSSAMPGALDRLAQIAHGAVEPEEYGVGDDRVADVHLGHLGDGHDRADVVACQPVPGCDLETELAGTTRRRREAPQLLPYAGTRTARLGRVAVLARVQLDLLRPDRRGGLHVRDRRVDEEAHLDARLPRHDNGRGDGGALPHDVETTLGRALGAALGHERDDVRAHPLGERDHLFGRGHLQVEQGRDRRAQAQDVV